MTKFHHYLLLVIITIVSLELSAQHKKNIDFYELDVNHGKLFQPNTIKPYTGTAHEKYGDGRKKKRIPIKDGQVHGKVEEWGMNGKKTAELNYVKGVPTGKERQWYDSGQLKVEANYENGVVRGVVTEWYESGKKKSEGKFVDGKEEGVHEWWFNNGAKDQMITYRGGKANGLVKHWHFNGQQKLEGTFREGRENGPFKEWHLNGALDMEGKYTDGLKDSVFKTYSKKGIIQQIETFERGTLVKSLDYRNGSINWDKGYTQVFNGKESFYTVDILGDNVYPRETTREVIYIVERYLLQMFNNSTELFLEKGEIETLSEADILKRFVDFESKYIEEKTGQKIEVVSEIKKNAKGQSLIYWSFKRPLEANETITPRTVVEEHYISMLCKKEILNLYGLVAKVNQPEEVKKMLFKVADTVEVKKERIELNALNKQLHR